MRTKERAKKCIIRAEFGQLLANHKISLKEVSETAGMSYATLQGMHVHSDTVDPQLSNAAAVLDALGYDLIIVDRGENKTQYDYGYVPLAAKYDINEIEDVIELLKV